MNYIELADVNPDYSEIGNSQSMLVHELPSRATYELESGDIITAVAGNSIGTKKHVSAIVSEKYKGAICTNGLRVFKTEPEIDPYYLLYYLKSDFFLKQVFKLRTGAAIPSISDEDLLSILIYTPNIETQKMLAEKMKKAEELREQSKKLVEDINIEAFLGIKQ